MNSKVMFNDAKLNQDNRKCRNFHFKRLRKVLPADKYKTCSILTKNGHETYLSVLGG